MKFQKFISFIAIIFLYHSCGNEDFSLETDWEKWHLNDSVKTIKVSHSNFLSGDTDSSLSLSLKASFSPHGFIVKEEHYDKFENLVQTDIYNRDEYHRVITLTKKNPDNKLISTHKYTYDGPNVTEIKVVESNTQSEKRLFVMEYDAENREILNETYSSEILQYSTETDYTEDGLIETSRHYDESGKLMTEAKAVVNKDETEITVTFKTKRLPTQYITMEIQKDLHNNIIERIQKNKNENDIISRFSYVYDQKNNWIRQKKQVDGNLQLITNREIEYY